jgi:uncharacterized protein YecE (DUF72 family)
MASSVLYIGTAGWAIRADQKALFPDRPSHLARYATRFNCVEINSSFYRPHRPATYAKWAASVPAGFRFAVKMPRTITHNARLSGAEELLDRFLKECTALGEKLGPILIQLPPSLKCDENIAENFFTVLRAQFDGLVALEPRHDSWFAPKIDALLKRYRIARVAADPIPSKVSAKGAAQPGGDTTLAYYRLHGSPRIYYSAYEKAALERLAAEVAVLPDDKECWCVFDNTALGHAAHDAASLQKMTQRDVM